MYILGYIKSNFPPYPPWPVEDDAALFEITGCSNEEINGYYTYKKNNNSGYERFTLNKVNYLDGSVISGPFNGYYGGSHSADVQNIDLMNSSREFIINYNNPLNEFYLFCNYPIGLYRTSNGTSNSFENINIKWIKTIQQNGYVIEISNSNIPEINGSYTFYGDNIESGGEALKFVNLNNPSIGYNDTDDPGCMGFSPVGSRYSYDYDEIYFERIIGSDNLYKITYSDPSTRTGAIITKIRGSHDDPNINIKIPNVNWYDVISQ